MLALSRLQQDWIAAALAAVVVWIIGRWALRRMIRSLLRQIDAQRPRMQPLAFVQTLRKQFFANPFVVMKQLWSEGRDAYVLGLWRAAGSIAERSRQLHNLPPDGLHVHRMHLADGRPFAVIVMPEPQKNREPYLIGLILPADPRFEHDLTSARRAGEIFILNRGGGGDTQRTTDLCGWRSDGRELTYNTAAPTDPEGFARAVGARLAEMGR